MKNNYLIFFCGLLVFACNSQTKSESQANDKLILSSKELYYSKITSNEFFASYKGSDFVNGDDIAHQLSNFVADTLGKYLKCEYKIGNYKKVDFSSTEIKTFKYHPDSVYYTIKMPLKSVSACEAYTCIDHRGSWISLESKTDSDLKEFIAKISVNENHKEEIKLFTTEFGLYEYWVQFRHPLLQVECK